LNGQNRTRTEGQIFNFAHAWSGASSYSIFVSDREKKVLYHLTSDEDSKMTDQLLATNGSALVDGITADKVSIS
jgi:hypothetical protein